MSTLSGSYNPLAQNHIIYTGPTTISGGTLALSYCPDFATR